MHVETEVDMVRILGNIDVSILSGRLTIEW